MTTNSKWATLMKSRIVPCLILLCPCLWCLFHQCSDKGDEVVMRDWIDNFPPVWQRTIRSKSTQDRAETLPPTSWAYVMLFAIFLKRQKLFLHQLNSKNNGSVLWLKTILWYWYCFTLSVAIHWNLGQQDTWHTSTRWVYDWFRYVRCGRRRLWSSL